MIAGPGHDPRPRGHHSNPAFSQLPDRGMVRRQAFAICEKTERTDRYLPGVNKHSFRGFQICREAPAAEEAVKKRRLDNHAYSTFAEGRLSAEYFKNLTAGKWQTDRRRSRYRPAGLAPEGPVSSFSDASSLSICSREPTVIRR
jgi:hypothetical protein